LRGANQRACAHQEREPRRGLRHAAGVGDRKQDIQIAECEPAADAVIPVHIRSI
jgi:hypothetical protein